MIEVTVAYITPLRFDDVVDVHAVLAAATRASFQIAYLLTIDGRPAATGVTVHGCVTPDGRPTRLPSWLQEAVDRR